MASSIRNWTALSRYLKLGTLSAISTLYLLVGCAIRTPEQQTKHDDAHYSFVLSPYLRDLKPGVSRREVEDYLHTRNIEFRSGCCAAMEFHSYDPNRPRANASEDWVRLPDEKPPWPCGYASFYIIFEFKRLRPSSAPERIAANDTDTLEGVHILKTNNNCF